jgi:LacI family transcriptional regulator
MKRSRAATIKVVAQKAGVSTATVSHVINNTRFVSEQTRERVLSTMQDLDYEPSLLARALRSQKTKIIGILMPIMIYDNFDYYFMKLAHGAQDRLKDSGYDVLLSSFDNSLDDERRKVESFRLRSIDGLILLPTEGDHSYLNDNRKINFPIVLIDRMADGFEGDCVLADNYRGSRKAIEVLLSKGHRKVGFIVNNLRVTTVLDRIRAYKDALSSAGLRIDDRLIRIGPYEYQSGYELTRDLLQSDPGITALFYGDNLLTMGGLQFINERGLRIPDRLAIVGFDDFEWERVTSPPLSVVRQPAHEIGRKSAEVLLQKIASPTSKSEQHWFPTELVLRGSI